jgi:protein-S-isoprenylcysteine O-methyltransferase Ste14
VDAARYYLALILVVTYPPAFAVWFVIHPFIGFWRRMGAAATYAVTMPAALAVCYLIFRFRDTLLGVEFGTNRVLLALGIVLYSVAMAVELRCRRYLTLRTLLGVPELRAVEEGPGELLRQGIYARVRHPRYLGVMLGGAGVACVANYLASYLLMLGLIPVVYALTVIEERELRQRFGEAYERYSGDVPRLLPRLR